MKKIKEFDYNVYYDVATDTLLGFNKDGVAALYVSDLDKALPALNNAPRTVKVKKAKLIVYE